MKKIKFPLAVLLSLLVVSGCSSGNPTTPNKNTLTNLAKNPAVTPENEIKKINITGRVIDSVTRKPVEGASILLYVISSDELMKKVKEGVKSGIPVETSPSPSNGASASPSSDGSSSTSDSTNPSANLSPSPVSSPVATVSPNPAPVEENEELITSPSVAASPSGSPATLVSASPSVPSAKQILETEDTKDISAQTRPGVLTSPSPSGSPESEAQEDAEQKKINEISEELLASALTNLKLNDIQEFDAKTGNDGKFWISKVPDTSVIVTINAPNYKTVSIFNLDTSKTDDIVIEPLQVKKDLLSVKGNVYSATNSPINNASVSVSYPVNDIFSIPVSSDPSGDFKIDDVKEGERTFLATVKEPSGKITSLGMLDFEVKKSPKSTSLFDRVIKNIVEDEEKLAPTVSETDKLRAEEKVKQDKANAELKANPTALEPTKEDTKTTEEIERKEVVRDKTIPNIKVKSVTEYIDLKGKIEKADTNILKSINVYISFKKKGLPKEEVYLTDKQIKAGADSFELSLPKLDPGYSYHLEFVSVNKKGSYVYHHENNIKKDDKEMKIKFMTPLSTGKVDFIEKEGEKIPIFSWTTVEAANFYKISIDKMDKNNNVTTVWEGITPFNTAIYPITTGSAKLNSANKYFWNVVAIKEGSVTPERIGYSKLNVNSWTDLSSSPNMEFSLSNTGSNEDIEEIESKKEG